MRRLSPVVFCLCSIRVVVQAQTPADATADGVASSPPSSIAPAGAASDRSGSIHWGSLVKQWWTYIAIEQVERIVKEPKTRRQLGGPFFGDWFNTVSDYRFDNWDDGGKYITSYLGHPAQGAI